MEIFSIIMVFALGAIIASFVGVIVSRLNTGQGFINGRSRCDACNTTLSSFSLIPIFSYIISGGYARCCSVRLSSYAPLTELSLGGLFTLSYFTFGFTLPLIPFLLSLSLLLALVLYDLSNQILPPILLALFVAASSSTGFLLASSFSEFSDIILIAFCIAFFLALIHFFSRGRAMGLADAPLVFGLALLTGDSAFSGFIFSFWIGSVIGILLLARRPRGTRMGVEVPFTPFLAAGFLLAYFTQWNPFAFIAALS